MKETQTVGSTLGWSQFTKGHNSVNVVMVLNLCTSSDMLYTVKPVLRGHPKKGQKVAA